jgi:hypothetical protein
MPGIDIGFTVRPGADASASVYIVQIEAHGSRVELRTEHERGQPIAVVTIGEAADTVRKWPAAILTLTKVQISEATNEQFVTT